MTQEKRINYVAEIWVKYGGTYEEFRAMRYEIQGKIQEFETKQKEDKKFIEKLVKGK